MPLVHVSPRETSLQSTASATPYSFLSPSSFIPEARMGSGGDTAFFLASRDRSMNLGSNCASSGVSSDGITYLTPSLAQYQNTELPSLSSVPSDGSEFNGFTQKDAKRESENWAPTDSSQQPMNQLQQAQTHVAQQSRREKLRIPGSLHPASPQSGTHSDHSAGSASALEIRQGAPVQQSEHMETSAQMRYSNQTNMNDVLPVYNASLISADPFNFPTGAELLAMSAKNNGYMGNSVGDMLPQSPALVGTIYSGQAIAFPNQAMVSKGSNWNNGNGQLGQGNPLPGMPANGTHGNGLTVLVGSGMQSGSFGSSVKDGYFSGSNPQAEMQLYLMNAGGYSGYTDATSGGNMVFITSPNGGVTQNNLVSRAQNHHLVGTPVESQNAISHGSAVNSSSYGSLSSSIVGSRSVYSNWRNADELVFMPSSEATQRTNSQSNPSMGPMTDIPEYNNRPSPLPGQQQTLLQAGIGHRLEENIQNGHVGYHSQHPQSHGFDVQLQLGVNNSATINSAEAQAERTAQFVNKINKIQDLSQFRPIPKEATSPTGYPNVVSGNVGKHMHIDQSLSALSGSFNFISNSRYLKPAQQVLDEACSVGRTLKPSNSRQRGGSQAWTGQSQAANSTFSKDGTQDHASNNVTTGASTATPTTVSSSAGTTMPSSNVTESVEVTAARTPEERQDLESKKTKLVAMLQEVDRRYRQYYDQMQVVISSFDAVAGVGAAVPYTALALQAMSRYFRCLRDAVTGQIQATCTALGEEDISKQITSRGSSRLRIVDQQLRQQRAFQQLGMLHHNAWRPQRGLPERSVSILRAWLFEHFLHPYPKDADKLMLARQTGLSRSQVSNWFINARVRLWKPMVEEMYQEEARDEGDVPLVRLNGDGDGDGSCSDKSGKAESKHEENAKAATNDSKLQSEGGQDFLDGGSLSSDYMISNTHSLRRQGVGTLGTCAQDVQLFEEAQKETMRQAQLKKSRYGIEDSILSTNAGIEVDMKPQDTSNVNVCENDHKFANTDRANSDQYSISQSNGVLHADFPSYEGNMARYGSTAFASGYPGNGVSLTLGLRHSENLSLCGAQQAYIHSGQTFTIGRRDNVASEHDFSNLYDGNALSGSHIGENEAMDYQSRKHIESQLLHDFVA